MNLTTDQEERLERIRSAKDRGYWRDRLIQLAGHRRGKFIREWVQKPWGTTIPISIVVGSTSQTVRCATSEALERVINWLGGNPLEPDADWAHWDDFGWSADESWYRPGISMHLTVPQFTQFRLRFGDDDEVVFEGVP